MNDDIGNNDTGVRDSVEESLLLNLQSSTCERPFRARQNEGTYLYVRCGSRNPSSCKSCARIASVDQKRLIGSGCNVSELDNVTAEMLAPFRFYFVTLTAPSFGAIHRDDNDFKGTPVTPRKYRYREQVEWNQGSAQLFHATTAALNSRLPDTEWSFVREWQRRGAIHFHGILRVPRWINETEAWAELARLRTVKSGVFKWGRQFDVKMIRGDASSNAVRYMAKVVGYTAKQQGNKGKSDALMRFYRRLDWHANKLVCNRHGCAKNADCGGRLHKSFGYAGYMRTQSKQWSFAELTRKKLDEQRKAFVASANNGYEQLKLEFVTQNAQQEMNALFDEFDGEVPGFVTTMIRERLLL